MLELAKELEAYVDEIGAPATEIVIALSALSVQKTSRLAARVYRRLARSMDCEKLEELAQLIQDEM